MTRAAAPLPSLSLWLAFSLALAAEGALLAGLAVWPAPRATPSPSTLIEVSLVFVPVLAESAAAGAEGGLLSPAISEPEPEPIAPEPPVATPAPAPAPVALAPKPKPTAKPKPKPVLKPKPVSPPKPTRRLAKSDQESPSRGKPGGSEKGTSQTSGRNQTAGKSSSGGPSSPAAYLNNPSPGYPDTARRLRQEGTVHLRVLVSANGRASEVAIAGSSGVASLDQAAIRAVRRWRFKPARQNGQAVVAWVRVPIRFKLNSPDG